MVNQHSLRAADPNMSEQELQKAKQKLPPGITLVRADDFQEWQMDIEVLDTNPIYSGQIFRLSFIFSSNYPIGISTII